MSYKYYCDICGAEDDDALAATFECGRDLWGVEFSLCQKCRMLMFDELIEKLKGWSAMTRNGVRSRRWVAPPEPAIVVLREDGQDMKKPWWKRW